MVRLEVKSEAGQSEVTQSLPQSKSSMISRAEENELGPNLKYSIVSIFLGHVGSNRQHLSFFAPQPPTPHPISSHPIPPPLLHPFRDLLALPNVALLYCAIVRRSIVRDAAYSPESH